MKITIEFDSSNEEDMYEYKHITKAQDYYFALFNIQKEIRNKIKYSENDTIKYEEFQELFLQELENKNINLDI